MTLRRFSTSNITTGTKSHKMWDGETFPGYFESIATAVAGSSGSTAFEFTNIPQNYTHLQLRCFTRNSSASGINYWYLLVNSNIGDVAYNYANHQIHGTGNSAAVGDLNSASGGYGGFGPVAIPGTATTSLYAATVIDILDYTNTNKNKVIRGLSGYDANGSGDIALISTVWLSTAAITKLVWQRFGGDTMAQYSHAALYGIRSA